MIIMINVVTFKFTRIVVVLIYIRANIICEYTSLCFYWDHVIDTVEETAMSGKLCGHDPVT